MHPPIRRAILEALRLIIEEDQYSDKVIERIGKENRQLGARDRRSIAGCVYGIIRNWRKLEFHAGSYEDVLDIFLETNGDVSTANMDPATRHSVCDELYETMTAELGETQTEDLLLAMDDQADVFIRPNSLKIDQASLLQELRTEGFELGEIKEPTHCLVLKERKNLFATDAYKTGQFEVQDVGSQCLPEILNPQPGDRVVDACAGAGGKSLQMAALMKNKGKLIAMDIHQWKLDELRKRARRAGVDVIETKLIETTKTIKRLHGSADKLLLDVPCTGTGVIKRKPDTKLKYNKAEHKDLLETQAQILTDYSKMLKVGGQMLYATCSVLPSENEDQIQKFLEQSEAEWKLDSTTHISPVEYNSDGFFAALLTKQT